MATPASSWQQEARDALLESSQRGSSSSSQVGTEVFLLPVQGNHHNFLGVSEFIVSGVWFSLRLTQSSGCARGGERWLQGWRMAEETWDFVQE